MTLSAVMLVCSSVSLRLLVLRSSSTDNLQVRGLTGLIDSKLVSHHKSLTRLVEENIDDFIGEAINYMDEVVKVLLWSTLQWFLTLVFPMALPV